MICLKAIKKQVLQSHTNASLMKNGNWSLQPVWGASKSQLSWQTKNDCCTPDAQSAVFRHLLRTKLESIIDHVIFSRLNKNVLYWGYPYLEFSNKSNSQRGQFRCWALHQKSYVSGPTRIAETSRRRGEESCPVWVCLRMGYSQVRDDHHVSIRKLWGIPW